MLDYDAFIKRQKWTFAKTMKKTPHWYANRKIMSEDDKWIFDKFVQYIRDNGIKAIYWCTEFTYLYHEGYYYWTMGYPIEQTYILNRASEKTNKIIDGVMYINDIPQISKRIR